jgi:hypothetical protein
MAEVRIGGYDLGERRDSGVGENLVDWQVHAVGVGDAYGESGRGQRLTARGEDVVMHAERLRGCQDLSPDRDEGGLDGVPWLDPSCR